MGQGGHDMIKNVPITYPVRPHLQKVSADEAIRLRRPEGP